MSDGVGSAWRWYAVPAVVLVVLLIADLTGVLEVLRPSL